MGARHVTSKSLNPAAKTGLELCFQQSAGNSAGPEIDALLGIFGDRFLDHDVGDL